MWMRPWPQLQNNRAISGYNPRGQTIWQGDTKYPPRTAMPYRARRGYFVAVNPMPTPGYCIWLLYEGTVLPSESHIAAYGKFVGFNLTTFSSEFSLGKAISIIWTRCSRQLNELQNECLDGLTHDHGGNSFLSPSPCPCPFSYLGCPLQSC
jgi:hypothetical protein